MSSLAPTAAATPDADFDDAILRAEWKRRMLERLAEVGMELVEQVRARALARPDVFSGEPARGRVDFAQAFAQASRAVRLTLALHTQIEQELLALRKGERPSSPSLRPAPPSEPGPAPAPEPGDARRAERARVRRTVFAAVDHAIGDRNEAFEILDRADEGLAERAEYERFLNLPFRDCIAAICADLGFDPHWSRWSDWEGFVADDEAHQFDWAAEWRARRERELAPSRRAAERVRVPALE